jgi:hypothetical protein
MECGSVSKGAGGPPGIRQGGKKDFILSKDLPEQDRIRRIFRAAIGFEKESIIFFLGMKELVPENLEKNRIDKIIKEVMLI